MQHKNGNYHLVRNVLESFLKGTEHTDPAHVYATGEKLQTHSQALKSDSFPTRVCNQKSVKHTPDQEIL